VTGEFRECKRSDQRIQKGKLARHGRCGMARARRRDIPTGRIARKIHGKETVWVVRQAL